MTISARQQAQFLRLCVARLLHADRPGSSAWEVAVAPFVDLPVCAFLQASDHFGLTGCYYT